ncbi:RNA polymerase sigma factor, partial [Brevundimonas sp. UBA7664]
MSVPDGAEAVDDRMEAGARLARLNAAMSRLPPHLKAPLLLTAIEGRSQAETAGMLGVSIKTVETRVARARRKLSEALDDTTAVRAVPE